MLIAPCHTWTANGALSLRLRLPQSGTMPMGASQLFSSRAPIASAENRSRAEGRLLKHAVIDIKGPER